MSSLSHCQFVIKIEFQVKNHFSSEIKGITLVVSIFQGSMSHFIPVYSPLIFFLQVLIIQSVQLLSGVWFFVTPMVTACPDCSTPGFSVHQLPDLAQAHVHWVSDAIQPSHPLSSPSPFTAAFTICSDFGGQENSLSLFPLSVYFSWSDGTRCHDLSFLNVQL